MSELEKPKKKKQALEESESNLDEIKECNQGLIQEDEVTEPKQELKGLLAKALNKLQKEEPLPTRPIQPHRDVIDC